MPNAYSRTEFLGTNDLSAVNLEVLPTEVPLHTAKFYILAEKGPTGPRFINGAITALYGEKTFEADSKFFTPATRFLQGLMGAGSGAVVDRVVPADGNKLANMVIYVDILQDTIDVYKRNVDGSIAYDADGNPITDGTTTGYRVKLIKEVNDVDPLTPVGTLTAKTGTMTDADGNPSTMYPIMEVRGAYQGSYYNNVGLSFNLVANQELDPDFIVEEQTLPYEVYVWKKDDNGTGQPVKDLFGAVKEIFAFKPKAKNPVTGLSLDINDTLSYWYNTTNPDMPIVYPDLDKVYLYTNNLETVLNMVIQAEAPYIFADVTTVDGTVVNTAEWFDFIGPDDLDKQIYLYNIFNGFSTKRVPYFGMVIDETAGNLAANQKEITFSYNIPAYLEGGVDGTCDFATYESLVSTKLDNYIDPAAYEQNLVLNPENIIYDVGFSIDIKKKLFNFIALRKDTFVVVGTREFTNQSDINLIDERAIAANLKARADLVPESTYFGTGVTRAMIVMGDGKLKAYNDPYYYPLTFDIGIKASKMMGSSQGWKKEMIFDIGAKNTITEQVDIRPNFIPETVKGLLWGTEINYPEPYNLNGVYYFPAMQTIYSEDTSILNNFFVAMALTVINKVADEARRYFTGSTQMTNEEFIAAVEDYLIGKLKDKFAGVVNVVPKVMITDFDKLAGYRWTVAFDIYGNVSKTVMTTYINAYRTTE